MPQVFDARDERFQSEREQLRELLTQQEYNAARRTILNAHYTANDYVDPMWEAMLQMGFTGGQVLEPGCGSGQFLQAAPVGDSRLSDEIRLTGVELDPVTAPDRPTVEPPGPRTRGEFRG
ncbi:hypothetical protein FV141_14255 (plasmid) [Dermacoccus abyssi]|uniref:Class I SAM-dependent methyltransferase n=1 Tax=Dermacoccus abyssi TaxID=322596 RepID=A0ABX5ZCP8_9MICO|nr:hypothetical protein FV141_14255 [Dermacoccus abyssi]